MVTKDSLAIRSTVRELVAAFASAEADVRAAFAMIVDAEARINAVFTLAGNRDIRIDASWYGYHDDFLDVDRAVERMRRDAWRVVVERLELRRMMSIARFGELEKQIKDGEVPALTEENVHAFVNQHVSDLPTMIGEAVAEVFEWLRPHRSEYKTNTELEVGERVVLSYMVESDWCGGYRVSYGREQHVIALENVFSALDGKGSVAKTHFGRLGDAIRESKTGRGETEYFEFKCWKNRNLHLRFKRLDLLDRFNRIAGGMRLRPAS